MDATARAEIVRRDAAAVEQHRAKVAELSEREMRALELYVLGATLNAIARAVDLKTHSAALKFVRRALAKRAQQVDSVTVSEARAIMHDRYDRLIGSFLPTAAATGDDKAAKIVIDALKGQARLLGLDAPRKVDVEHHIGESDEDRREREERVRARLAEFQDRTAKTIEGELAA